jgi:hypothetical protein
VTDGARGARRIFQSVRAPGRARHLEAVIEPDGSIRIHGQDVSNGVVEADEFSTYEWTWLIRPADVPRAMAVLGGASGEAAGDVLDRWMAANPADPGMTISRAGVEAEFSSRMGD